MHVTINIQIETIVIVLNITHPIGGTWSVVTSLIIIIVVRIRQFIIACFTRVSMDLRQDDIIVRMYEVLRAVTSS